MCYLPFAAACLNWFFPLIWLTTLCTSFLAKFTNGKPTGIDWLATLSRHVFLKSDMGSQPTFSLNKKPAVSGGLL
jgi:hypothetical protein